MAYNRGNFHQQDKLIPPSKPALDFESEDLKHKRNADEKQPLRIFCFDISKLSDAYQYAILALGLLIFMCLYGYFQELVIYGWFERRLSIFSTFLHFLGCSIFAEVRDGVGWRDHFKNITLVLN